MADVITRFKLETTQYDSKLRDASKSLADYAKEASKAGGEFDKFTKSNVDAARAFGTISTSASNAKDKVKELVGAYNTAANAYNALTKEQQQSDFGKALAASMTQLKGRISEAKQEMNSTGGIMDQLAQKFTVSFDAVKMFNVGLQAAQGALKVAKDAFFNNEESLDEWGRVVQSSQSLYEGFLNALNTGNISGFLSNIGNIVSAARNAYDALDALGTFNAFNQINVEKTRTGMTESIVDYREGKTTKEAVKASGEAYKNELKERKRLESQAYLNAVKEMAAKRGVNEKDLIDALSGTYGHYQDLKNVQPTGVRQTVVGAGMFARTGTETFAQTRQEKLGEALRHLNDTELKSLQALGAQAERTGNEIAGIDRQLSRVLHGRQYGSTGGRGGHGGGMTVKPEEIIPTGSMADLNKQIQELRSAQDKATNVGDWKKYEQQIWAVTNRVKELKGQLSNIESGNMSSLSLTPASISRPVDGATSMDDVLNKGEKAIANFKPPQTVDDLIKKGRETQQAWNMAAGAVQNVGAAFSQIEDPSVKAMGTVTQAIASIALGFATASAQSNTAGTGWGWLAWVAAGAAAMATAISTIHSLTNLAGGGIVPGNSFSGDNIYGGGAMVNSGELVLNTAQQVNLANALQSSNGGLSVETVVRGEDLRIMIRRNSNRRSGGFETLR